MMQQTQDPSLLTGSDLANYVQSQTAQTVIAKIQEKETLLREQEKLLKKPLKRMAKLRMARLKENILKAQIDYVVNLQAVEISSGNEKKQSQHDFASAYELKLQKLKEAAVQDFKTELANAFLLNLDGKSSCYCTQAPSMQKQLLGHYTLRVDVLLEKARSFIKPQADLAKLRKSLKKDQELLASKIASWIARGTVAKVAQLQSEAHSLAQQLTNLKDYSHIPHKNAIKALLYNACESGDLLHVQSIIKGYTAERKSFLPFLTNYAVIYKTLSELVPEAVHIACERGYIELVRYFIQLKYWPLHTPNKFGLFPIHYAMKSASAMELLVLLEKAGVDISFSTLTPEQHKCLKGRTLLHSAVMFGQLGAVKELLKRFPNWLNVQETGRFQKDSPLHLAAFYGHVEICNYLLQKRAKTDLLNANRLNAFMAMLINPDLALQQKEAIADCFIVHEQFLSDAQLEQLATDHAYVQPFIELISKKQASYRHFRNPSSRDPAVKQAIAEPASHLRGIDLSAPLNPASRQLQEKYTQKIQLIRRQLFYGLSQIDSELEACREELAFTIMKLGLISTFKDRPEMLTEAQYNAELKQVSDKLVNDYETSSVKVIDDQLVDLKQKGPDVFASLIAAYRKFIAKEIKDNHSFAAFRQHDWQLLQKQLAHRQEGLQTALSLWLAKRQQELQRIEQQQEPVEAVIKSLEKQLESKLKLEEQQKAPNAIESCCLYGRVEELEALLAKEKKLPLEVLCEQAPFALHLACRAGKTKMVRYLLEKGCAVNEHDGAYYPIHYAAIGCRSDALLILLEASGAVLDIVSPVKTWGRTALHSAAYFGNSVALNWLLSRCPLLVNQPENLHRGRAPYHVPLHEAAYGGYSDICHTLFAKGAQGEVRNRNGKTPLMYLLTSSLSIEQKVKVAGIFLNNKSFLLQADIELLKKNLEGDFELLVLPVLEKLPNLCSEKGAAVKTLIYDF